MALFSSFPNHFAFEQRTTVGHGWALLQKMGIWIPGIMTNIHRSCVIYTCSIGPWKTAWRGSSTGFPAFFFSARVRRGNPPSPASRLKCCAALRRSWPIMGDRSLRSDNLLGLRAPPVGSQDHRHFRDGAMTHEVIAHRLVVDIQPHAGYNT